MQPFAYNFQKEVELMSIKKCTNCGADLDPAAKFCMECGMEQTTETPAEPENKSGNESEVQPVSEPQTANASDYPDSPPDAGHIPDYSMNNGGYKVEDGGNGGASALFVVMILGILLMASVVIWAAFAILANVPNRQKSSEKFIYPDNDYSYHDDWEYPDDPEEYGGDSENSGIETNPYEPDPDMEGYYPEDTYQIGVDIPEGIYFLRGEVLVDEDGMLLSDARYEVNSDGDSDGGWFQFCRYVELRGQGSIDLTFCDAYDISVADVHGDPFEHPGMFIVGRDLDPGTYKLVDTALGGNSMVYAVYDSLDEVYGNSIFDVGDFDAKDGDEITLTDGQILEMQWCVLAEDEQ